MEYVNYEKPRMKVVDLRSEQAIAGEDGPCMAQAAQGHRDFYYDAPGDGWVWIHTDGKNCNGNASFEYVDNPKIPGEVDAQAKANAIAAAEKALNDGKQVFSGAVVDRPDPAWS